MSSAPTSPDTTYSSTMSWGGPVEEPRAPLRLRLKPKAATTGFVDGGWWPRSRDLAVELPGLLAVLAVRLGRIERVSYHLGDWGPTPARLSVEGGVVRLVSYRTQHANFCARVTSSQVAARRQVASEELSLSDRTWLSLKASCARADCSQLRPSPIASQDFAHSCTTVR